MAKLTLRTACTQTRAWQQAGFPELTIAVNVSAGDAVEQGAVLMVVEAMKMEHKITAPSASTVTEVHFEVGARVDQGDLLVSLDEADDAGGGVDG